MRKYKITECMDKLPHKEYSKAMKSIPKILGVAPNTFKNYKNFYIDDSRDIPHKIVCKLELIFNLEGNTLKNYEVNLDPVERRIRKKKP